MFNPDRKQEVQTSDEELLAVGPGVTLGLLQQADPVVHLLGSVRVAVDDTVRRDDHKRVWSAERDIADSRARCKQNKIHIMVFFKFSRWTALSPVRVVWGTNGVDETYVQCALHINEEEREYRNVVSS